jgi:hypothetical protein
MDAINAPGRWGRVSEVVERGPVKRSKLYNLARKHKGLFRNLDGTTIVDTILLDEICASSPPAELKTPE